MFDHTSAADSFEFKSELFKGYVRAALNDVFRHCTDKDVSLYKRPTKVTAHKRFGENQLKLCPLTSIVGIAAAKHGRSTVPPNAIDMGSLFEHASNSVHAYIKQPTIMPTEKNSGFFVAYWLVTVTVDPSEANSAYKDINVDVTMHTENCKAYKTTVNIPVIVNTKAIDKGMEIIVLKRKRVEEAPATNKKTKQ